MNVFLSRLRDLVSAGPRVPRGWVRRRAGRLAWAVRPDWAETLLGPDGLRRGDWQRAGIAQTLKANRLRTVVRVDHPHGVFYVKTYASTQILPLLKTIPRGSKARIEFNRALRLPGLGLRTFEPIAIGERRRWPWILQSVLVTREIADAEPLGQRLSRPADGAAARRLTARLAALIATLHDAGCLHQDLHPGNLLVRRGTHTDDPDIFFLIDLDTIAHQPTHSESARIANLARFDHYFWFRYSATDRYRFLRHYAKLRDRRIRRPFKAFAAAVEHATRRWAEILWTRRAKRASGTNAYFRTGRSAAAWGVAARSLSDTAFRALLDHPDAPFGQNDTEILKSSKSSVVARIADPGTGPGTRQRYLYKALPPKGQLWWVWSLLRPGRGWRTWQATHHLAVRGIPTPEGIAYLARRWPARGHWPALLRPPLGTAYLLSAFVEGAVTLADLLAGSWPDSAERLDRLAPRLASLLRRMHAHGLSHRDLKAANLLVSGEATGDAPLVIDTTAVVLRHPLTARRRAQNLARLYLSVQAHRWMSRSKALRFVYAYNPRLRRNPAVRAWFFDRIARWAQRKVQRNAQNRRPLT